MSSAWSAVLMVWLTGATLVAALDARGRRYDLFLYLALGFLPGCGLVALLQWLVHCVGGQPQHWIPAILTLATAAAGLYWWYAGARHRTAYPRFELWTLRRWRIALPLVLMSMLTLLLAAEGQSRPIYPWDAWSAWAVKAKVWHALGQDVNFISFHAWLQSASPNEFTNEAWQYPELVPLLQLWSTRWLEAWSDSAAVAWWPPLWISLLLLFGCGLRRLGVTLERSVLTAMVYATIPIAATQIALPGYVDIWLAAAILAACVCWSLWRAEQHRGFGFLAITMLMMVGALKLEGVVWAALLALAAAYSLLDARKRKVVWIATPILFLVWWLAGGFSFNIGSAGELVVKPDLLAAPYLGRYPLEPANPGSALAQAFLALPNWHLVWYLLPLLAPLAWWRGRGTNVARDAALYWVFGGAFMVLLFFFTHASAWVDSMTASNRLALQYGTAAIFWTALLLGRDQPSES